MKKELLAVLRQTVQIKVDVKAGSKYIVNNIIEPRLQKVVDDSANPFDNMAMATLLPEVKKQMIEATGKANDYLNGKIQKLMGYEEPAQ